MLSLLEVNVCVDRAKKKKKKPLKTRAKQGKCEKGLPLNLVLSAFFLSIVLDFVLKKQFSFITRLNSHKHVVWTGETSKQNFQSCFLRSKQSNRGIVLLFKGKAH